MLKTLRVRNSYTYYDETTFDFSANKDVKEHASHVYYPNDESDGILSVAAIYGSNASGKTNFIRVLEDISLDALNAFGQIDVDILSPIASDSSLFKTLWKKRRFAFLDEPLDCISYSICVVLEEGEYELSYCFGEKGIINEKVTRRVNNKPDEIETMYIREEGQLIECIDKNLRSYLKILIEIKEPGLWFHFVARRQDSEVFPLYNWFCLVRSGISYNDILSNNVERFNKLAKDIYITEKPAFRTQLSSMIRETDPSVEAIHTHKSKDADTYQLAIYRNTDDPINPRALQIDTESAGILKLLDLYSGIYTALVKGQPFVCDELDKQLHPEVFLRLVNLFNDTEINDKRAQLIFTAHNTIVLNSDFLRSDEIHIVAKDRKGISVVKRLSEYVDEDGDSLAPFADFEQIYRNGGFGSFPKEFLNQWRGNGGD